MPCPTPPPDGACQVGIALTNAVAEDLHPAAAGQFDDGARMTLTTCSGTVCVYVNTDDEHRMLIWSRATAVVADMAASTSAATESLVYDVRASAEGLARDHGPDRQPA